MEGRGRKSAASLSVVGGQTSLESVARPKPPADLTMDQAEEWREVVNRLPADWFPRETWGLLSQYCRHIVSARKVQQLIATLESAEECDLAGYDRALKMQERESRCIASLATKMRISQQTSYDKSRKKPPVNKKPWHVES